MTASASDDGSASASSAAFQEMKHDDALHLETIIEDEELRNLVDNSNNGGEDGSNSGSSKMTKRIFDRSLLAMPRLMKTISVGGSSSSSSSRNDTQGGGGGGEPDDEKQRRCVFDWLLDALDALDDKIADKVERAEDALFDAFEDVQESFKKSFSFRKIPPPPKSNRVATTTTTTRNE